MYIDPLRLGSVISQHQVFVDVDNFIIQPLLKNKKVQIALITDVIVSNNFSLSTFTESDTALDIDVPAIANAIGNANVNLKVEKKKDNEVKFQGPTDLTFAFTCLELKIDPDTGKISRGEWLQNFKSASGVPRTFESLKADEVKYIEKLMIDDNEQYPLLIEM